MFYWLKLSSYKIQHGYYAQACDYWAQRGLCKYLTGSGNLPSVLNDKIMSISCVRGPPPSGTVVTSCSRVGHWVTVKPMRPDSKFFEVRKYSNKHDKKLFSGVTTGSQAQLSSLDERWFAAFAPQPFELRVINDAGQAGPWKLCTSNTPIGLDIDMSGAVERISGDFFIDLSGDGDIEHFVEWFAPTEGILIDTTIPIVNGTITGHHLFGDLGGTYTNGFAKLKEHDGDGDGEIDGIELEDFAIWTDANSNTKLDDGELSTLASHGIVALSTFQKKLVSNATLSDGSSMYMEDLVFATYSAKKV